MLNKILKTSLLVVFFLVFSFIFSSCTKEEPTIAIITVKDVNGVPLEGADVWLHQNGQISPQGELSNVSDYQQTDVNGKTTHEFDLEAILNIEAEITIGNNTYTGQNVIRLLRGKTVSKTVEVN